MSFFEFISSSLGFLQGLVFSVLRDIQGLPFSFKVLTAFVCIILVNYYAFSYFDDIVIESNWSDIINKITESIIYFCKIYYRQSFKLLSNIVILATIFACFLGQYYNILPFYLGFVNASIIFAILTSALNSYLLSFMTRVFPQNIRNISFQEMDEKDMVATSLINNLCAMIMGLFIIFEIHFFCNYFAVGNMLEFSKLLIQATAINLVILGFGGCIFTKVMDIGLDLYTDYIQNDSIKETEEKFSTLAIIETIGDIFGDCMTTPISLFIISLINIYKSITDLIINSPLSAFFYILTTSLLSIFSSLFGVFIASFFVSNPYKPTYKLLVKFVTSTLVNIFIEKFINDSTSIYSGLETMFLWCLFMLFYDIMNLDDSLFKYILSLINFQHDIITGIFIAYIFANINFLTINVFNLDFLTLWNILHLDSLGPIYDVRDGIFRRCLDEGEKRNLDVYKKDISDIDNLTKDIEDPECNITKRAFIERDTTGNALKMSTRMILITFVYLKLIELVKEESSLNIFRIVPIIPMIGFITAFGCLINLAIKELDSIEVNEIQTGVIQWFEKIISYAYVISNILFIIPLFCVYLQVSEIINIVSSSFIKLIFYIGFVAGSMGSFFDQYKKQIRTAKSFTRLPGLENYDKRFEYITVLDLCGDILKDVVSPGILYFLVVTYVCSI